MSNIPPKKLTGPIPFAYTPDVRESNAPGAWDKFENYGVNNIENQDIFETRAQNQSKVEKIGMGASRIAGKVVVEVGKMPGYVGGTFDWAASGMDKEDIGKMADNGYTQWFDKLDENIKENLLTVYTRKEVENGGLWRQVASPEFWATDAADGIGFLLSFLVPGAALKSVGIAGKLARAGVAANELRAGTNVGRAISLAGKYSKQIENGAIVAANTLFESAAETGEVVKSLKKYYADAMEKGELNPDTGRQYTKEEVAAKIGDAGVGTFYTNFGILLGPNALMQKNLFGAFSMGKKGITNVIGKASQNVIDGTAKGAESSITKEVAKRVLLSAGSEGLWEEGMQTTASNYFEDRAKGINKQDFVQGMMGEYVDMLGTTEGQKSIFLGALLGSVSAGIGAYRKESQENKAEAKLTELLSKNLNSFSSSLTDLYKKNEDGSLVIENGAPVKDPAKVEGILQALMGENVRDAMLSAAAEMKDKSSYERIFNDTFSDFVSAYVGHEGGLEALNAQIDNLPETLLTQLKSFKESTTSVENLKQDLKAKAKALNDRWTLIDAHDNDYFDLGAYNKADRELRDGFINKLKSNALLYTSRQDYFNKKKEELKSKSASLGNSETDIKLKESLEKEYESAQKGYDAAGVALKKIFSKKEQQEAFRSETDRVTKLRDTVSNSDATEKKEDQIKKTTNPDIQNIYRDNVLDEVIPHSSGNKTIAHKGELEFEWKDETGTTVKSTFTPKVINSNGSLELVATDPKSPHQRIFFKSDGTLSAGKSTIASGAFTYKQTKTAEVSRSMFHRNMASQFSKEAIDTYNSLLKENDAKLLGIVTKLETLSAKIEAKQSKRDAEASEAERKIQSAEATARVEGVNSTNLDPKEIEYVNKAIDLLMTESVSKLLDEGITPETSEDAILDALIFIEEAQAKLKELFAGNSYAKQVSAKLEALKTAMEHKYSEDTYASSIIQMEQEIAALTEFKTKYETYRKNATERLNKYNKTLKFLSVSGKTYDPKESEKINEATRQQIESLDQTISNLEAVIKKFTDKLNSFIEGIEDILSSLKMKLKDFFQTDLGGIDKGSLHYILNGVTDIDSDAKRAIVEDVTAIEKKMRFAQKRIDNSQKKIAKATKERAALKESLAKREKALDKYYTYIVKQLKISETYTRSVEQDLEMLQEKEQLSSFEENEDKSQTRFLDANSFLKTRGNQEKAIKNDDQEQLLWYSFVSTYDYAHDKDGNPLKVLQSITFEQATKLDPSDVLRQQLKFYVRGQETHLTVDQILQLEKEGKDVVNTIDDIKLVLVDRATGKPSLSNGKIVYNALASPDIANTFSVGFRKNEIRNSIIAKNGGVVSPEAEPALAAEVEAELKKELQEAVDKLNALRARTATETIQFKIGSKNSGFKLPAEHANPVVGTVISSNKELQNLEVIVPKKGTHEKFKNTYKVIPGLVYVWNKFHGVYEQLEQRKLNDMEVTQLIDLLKYSAAHPEAFGEIEKFIKSMVYYKQNSSKEYHRRMYPNTVKGKENQIESVSFGNSRITVNELNDPTSKKYAEFVEFLKDKFHNISKDALDQKEFTELYVENGELKRMAWKSDIGGYKGYLLSPNNKRGVKAKIRAKLIGNTANPIEAAKAPQYMNSSFNLVLVEKKAKAAPVTVASKPAATVTPSAPVASAEPDSNMFMPGTNYTYVNAPADGKGATTSGIVVKVVDDKFVLVSDTTPEKKGSDVVKNLNIFAGGKATSKTYKEVESAWEFFLTDREVPIVRKITLRAEVKAAPVVVPVADNSRIIKIDYVFQGRAFEIEINGVGKDFLVSFNGEKWSLFENKKNDLYVSGDNFASQEQIKTLLEKYLSPNLINALNAWADSKGEQKYADIVLSFNDKKVSSAPQEASKFPSLLNEEGLVKMRAIHEGKTDEELQAIFAKAKNVKPKTHARKDTPGKRIDEKAARAWFAEKFPDFPTEWIDKLINDELGGQLVESSKVLLSRAAAAGTEFHEGFHVVTQVFMNEDQRTALYKEYNERTGQNLTDLEAEEALAEEFRSFMLSDGTYKFPPTAKKQKGFFAWILDKLKYVAERLGLLTTKEETDNIANLFDRINNGSFSLANKVEGNTPATLNRFEGKTEEASQALLKDFNYNFFQILLIDESEELDLSAFDNIQDSLPKMYLKVQDVYKTRVLFDPNWANENVMKSWDEIVAAHRRYLKGIGIDIDVWDRMEEEEDEKSSKDTVAHNESNLKSMSEIMPNKIKLLLAALPVIEAVDTTNENGDVISTAYYAKVKDYYFTSETHRVTNLSNALHNKLSGATSYEEMITRMKDLTKQRPEMAVLVKWLGSKAVPTPEDASENLRSLQNAFFVQFSKNKNIPVVYMTHENGEIAPMNLSDQAVREKIKSEWMTFGKLDAKNPGSVWKYDSAAGEFILNKDAKIGSRSLTEIKNNPAIFNTSDGIDLHLQILNAIGIKISDNQKQITDYGTVKNLVGWILENLNKINTIDDLFSSDMDKGAINAEISKALDLAVNHRLDIDELAYRNFEGKLEHSITLNSYASKLVNNIRNGNVPERLAPWDGKKGNFFMVNSEWAYIIEEGKNFMRLELMSGYQSDFGDGVATSKLEFSDLLSQSANAVLNGAFPMLRAADRNLEYCINFGDVDYNLTEDKMIDILTGYLKDELYVSVAYAKGLIPSAVHFEKNLSELRSFKDVLSGMEISSIALAEGDPVVVVNDYVIKNLGRIRKSLLEHLNSHTKQNSDLMLENNLVYSNGDTVVPVQLDNKSISKITGRSVTELTKEEFDKVSQFITFRYMQGGIEQLKYFYGDLATYSATKDFHKRTTMVASTKNDLWTSLSNRTLLSKTYPRFDGADVAEKAYSDTAEMVIFDSKQLESLFNDPVLSKLYPGYKSYDPADGQSWASMDGIRSMMLMNGSWTNGHEMTYQWEMQQFGHVLLAMGEANTAFPFTTEDFIRLFGAHTNQTVPSSQMLMYKGKRIVRKDMEPIPPQKPQGIGAIPAVPMANQAFKTSIAPMFPSAFKPGTKGFDLMLSMIANKKDFMTFSSANKLEKLSVSPILDADGALNPVTPETSIMRMPWDDLGIQLEIHSEAGKNVTLSTQKRRLEFLDTYSNGNLFLGYDIRGNLKQEQKAILTELVGRNEEKLIKDLGLIKADEGYILKEGDVTKFKEVLKDQFTQRDMPYDVLEGLGLVLDSDLKLFDTLFTKNKISNLLSALSRTRTISMKVKGDMLVQESSLIYDETLKFYEQKDGETSRMEVMIPIPIQWLDWVQNEGGLDAFNEKLAAGTLGVDSRLFQFNSNRIPTTGLNMMEAIQVKKFLPHYYGSKIVLPPQIVVKAGSDFDIDKLFAYFSNYKIEKGKPVYTEYDSSSLENNSKAALENRLSELSQQTVLDKDNFENLIRPNSSALLSSLTEEVNGGKTPAPKMQDLVQWHFNMKRSREFWRSKDLVAHAAIHNTGHATSQQAPVRADERVEIYLDGQKGDDTFSMGHVHDMNGNLISESFAQFLTSFVDAAKDPFIFDLNVNDKTFAVFSFLNRFSRGDNPASIEHIGWFMNQPIIKDYLEQNALRKSIGAHHNRYVNMKDEKGNRVYPFVTPKSEYAIIQELIRKYDPKALQSVMPLYNITREFNDATGDKKTAGIEQINALKEKLNYKFLTEKQLKSKDNAIQLQVLDNFLTYSLYAGHLDNFQQSTRPDGGLPKNIGAVKAAIMKLDKVRERSIFVKEDVDNFIQGTELKAFQEAREIFPELYKEFFFTSKYEIPSKIFTKIMSNLLERRGSSVDMEKALDSLENDMIAFIVHTTKLNGVAINNHYRALLQGDNSIPRVLSKYKKELEGNPAVEALRPVLNEFVLRRGKKSEVDNIKLFSRKATPEEVDSMVSGFKEMLESKNPSIAILAKNLAYFSIVQSGMGRSNISFSEILPSELLQPIMKSYISEFVSSAQIENEGTWRTFEEQWYRNNWGDPTIVKRPNASVMTKPTFIAGKKVGTHFDTSYFSLNQSNVESNEEFMAFETSTVWGKDAEKLKAAGKRVPKRIILYRRSELPSETGWYKYKPTYKLGDGHRFKEFYNDNTSRSILADNAVEVAKSASRTQEDLEYEMLMSFEEGGLLEPGEFLEDYSQKTGQTIGTPAPVINDKRAEITQKMATVINETARKHLPKEQFKTRQATQYIGQGSPKSSTDNYMNLYKSYGLANTGKYSKSDLIYVSSNGARGGRVNPVSEGVLQGAYKNIDTAISVGARFIMDTAEHIARTSKYNLGEIALADYLSKKGYVREDKTGIWSPKNDKMFSLDSTAEPVNVELDNAMSNFLTEIGVDVNSVEGLKDSNGRPVDAIAVSDFIRRTVDVVSGKAKMDTLPEEAAHWYVRLLGKEHPTYKQMMKDITKYPIYATVKERYSNVEGYTEEKIREEAVGQVVSHHIVSKFKGQTSEIPEALRPQTSTWWEVIWNWIKKKLNVNDPYKKSALDVLNNKVAELSVGTEQSGEMYQMSPTTQRRLSVQDDVYQAAVEDQKRRERLARKEALKVNNTAEIKRVAPVKIETISDASTEVLSNFEKYFPGYSDYSPEQRLSFVEMMTDGELNSIC